MKRKTTKIASRSLIAMLAVVASLFAVTATAAAVVSTQDGYSGPGASVQGQVDAGDDGQQAVAPVVESSGTPPTSPGSGSLPFTGLELIVILGAGGMLLALGVGLRHLTRASGSGGPAV